MHRSKIIPISLVPTEQQYIAAFEPLQEVLHNMEQLQQNLQRLRGGGFVFLPESRRLKMQPIHRQKQSDPLCSVPGLQLAGEWLRQAGFECNEHVHIIPMHQILIVCPEKEVPGPGKITKIV